MGGKFYGSQYLLSTVWLPTFFQITFVFSRKKETHAGLDGHKFEQLTDFSFLFELSLSPNERGSYL